MKPGTGANKWRGKEPRAAPTWDEAVIENGKEYAPHVPTVENRTETRYIHPIQQTSLEYSLCTRQWVLPQSIPINEKARASQRPPLTSC